MRESIGQNLDVKKKKKKKDVIEGLWKRLSSINKSKLNEIK